MNEISIQDKSWIPEHEYHDATERMHKKSNKLAACTSAFIRNLTTIRMRGLPDAEILWNAACHVNTRATTNERNQTMEPKRVFRDEGPRKKAEDYHGGCAFNRTLPDIRKKNIKSVNIEVTFDEAVKLSLAIQSCLLALNKNNRSTTLGQRMGVILSVKTDNDSISVMEKKLGIED